MSGKITEKVLLYKVKVKQDPDAYGLLYDSYVKQIYRFVFFKVSSHEEAEDITSEVFLKAWHYLQSGKEVKSFSGLLYRIARTTIIDMYRAKASRPEVLIGEEDIDVSDSGKFLGILDQSIEVERIVKMIKKLKQEYQEVITLRFVDELELSEIAEIMDKGAVAVRVTLHRAIAKLKELVEE